MDMHRGSGSRPGGSRSVSGTSSMAHSRGPATQQSSPAPPERVLSPALSDTGSATSSTAYAADGSQLRGRLGSLHGAGLSTLNLALSSDAGFTAGASLVGFNAISTLLNNPNRPLRPIDPTSSRYPALTQSHTELPKVKRSDVDGTLNSIRAEWPRFQRNQKLGSRGKARLEGEGGAGVGDLSIGDASFDGDETLRDGGASMDEDPPARAAPGKKRLPPLSTVPQVFFAEDFELGNPYTFDLVTERYKAASSNSSSSRNGSAATGYDVALNQMLQEKLSYYSDVVEQHLILEISARSSSFFAALENLKDLEAESRACLTKVEHLQREMDERDEGVAKAGLHLIRAQAKRREIVERQTAVGVIHQLCEKRDLCQLLVQNNEWSEALDVMQELEDVIDGVSKLTPRSRADGVLPPHVDLDLSNIPSVKALAPQMQEIRASIASQLETELLSILKTDAERRIGRPTGLSDHFEGIERSMSLVKNGVTVTAGDDGAPLSPSKVGAPLGSAAVFQATSNISLLPESQQLADRIEVYVRGMARTQGVDHLIGVYKDVVLQVAKETMRLYLSEAQIPEDPTGEWRAELATLLEDDEAAQGKPDAKLGSGGIEAANRLKKLEQGAFVALLTTLLQGMAVCISVVDSQKQVLIKLLDEEGKRTSADEDGEEDTKADELSLTMPAGASPALPATMANIVGEVCSSTHIFASRLLSLRSTTHILLPLIRFLAIFHLTWSFILRSEAMCGRMIIGLRGVVLSQAKSWLAHCHRIRVERAAKAVEEEQWAQTEVSKGRQERVTSIVDVATSDTPTMIISKEDIARATVEGAEPADEKEAEGDAGQKTLTIEDRQYFVVSATLDVLDMLIDYLQIVVNLPLLTTEIMGRIVEFLKQFNSRTCQVVLGAGAMRSAGLKNITAKHLALASQSLSIMTVLIPYVREAVRRHLNPRQAVMLVEFDKLRRDYQEHQNEIHSKLVAIMSDRLTVHCRALANVDWSAPLADDEAAPPVKSMLDLVKETTTLHKVLCKYLQPNVVEAVIGQVLLSIDKRVASELRRLELRKEAARKRVSAILDIFREKLGPLRYVEWKSSELDEAFEEMKKVPDTPVKSSLDESRPMSPPSTTTPLTSYKPRMTLFARKQQQQAQAQAAATGPITATPSAPDSSGAVSRASVDLAPSSQRASVDLAQENRVNGDEPSTRPKAGETKIDEEAAEEADKTLDGPEMPPPTPSKDAVGADSGTSTPVKPSIDLIVERVVSIDTPSTTPGTPLRGAGQETVSDAQSPPTPASTITSPTNGRMTLQQRLAEAARRRAQATSRTPSRPSTAQNDGQDVGKKPDGEAKLAESGDASVDQTSGGTDVFGPTQTAPSEQVAAPEQSAAEEATVDEEVNVAAEEVPADSTVEEPAVLDAAATKGDASTAETGANDAEEEKAILKTSEAPVVEEPVASAGPSPAQGEEEEGSAEVSNVDEAERLATTESVENDAEAGHAATAEAEAEHDTAEEEGKSGG